jgi:hypothetical protein
VQLAGDDEIDAGVVDLDDIEKVQQLVGDVGRL